MASARDKILAKIRKLRRLATSSNEHEAKLAQEQADALIKKHNVTDEELRASGEERSSGKRFAGEASRDEDWKLTLAHTVAGRYGCKALRARGRIFFEGEDAVSAVGEYRMLVERIRLVRDSYGEANGVWSAVFLIETARTFAEEMRPDKRDEWEILAYYRAEVGSALRTASREGRALAYEFVEGFDVAGSSVAFRSNRPGNYATLFANGKKLNCTARSHFDNRAHAYRWVFELDEAPTGILVFATSEFAITGEVAGSSIRITSRSPRVARTREGEPMHVEVA